MNNVIKKISSLALTVALLGTSVTTLIANATCPGGAHGRQYRTYTKWEYKDDILKPNFYGCQIKVGYREHRDRKAICASCGDVTSSQEEIREIITNPIEKLWIWLGIS